MTKCGITKRELSALDRVLDFTTSGIDMSIPEERQLSRELDRVVKLRNKIGVCK